VTYVDGFWYKNMEYEQSLYEVSDLCGITPAVQEDENMRRTKIWMLALGIVVSSCSSITDSHFKNTSFLEVNPDECVLVHIWTPKKVYSVGEKIPLYIEIHHRKTCPFNVALSWEIKNPFLWNFRIYKAGYGKVTLWSKEFGSETGGEFIRHFLPSGDKSHYEGDFVPSSEEIPHQMLHGRLRQPVRNEVGKMECFIERGESFVLKISDLSSIIFLNKRDISGRYRVQWWYSNIIEFEVR